MTVLGNEVAKGNSFLCERSREMDCKDIGQTTKSDRPGAALSIKVNRPCTPSLRRAGATVFVLQYTAIDAVRCSVVRRDLTNGIRTVDHIVTALIAERRHRRSTCVPEECTGADQQQCDDGRRYARLNSSGKQYAQ
jgi:hypothetical protein